MPGSHSAGKARSIPIAVKSPGDRGGSASGLRGAGRSRPATGAELLEPRVAHRLLADTGSAWIWLFVRLYVGGRWLAAGAAKLRHPAWLNPAGFLGAPHPGPIAPFGAGTAYGYAGWLRAEWLRQPLLWSRLIAWGELAAGLAVLLGVLTGVFALMGILVDWHPLIAGAAVIDPLMVSLAVALVLAWRVGGWLGLDRWLLPVFGCRLRDRSG